MPMKKQFIQGNFLLEQATIKNGNIHVENGKITDFDEKIVSDCETVNLQGSLVIPTFKNAHVHLGETNFRPLASKMTLFDYISLVEQKNKEQGDKVQANWENAANTTMKECLQSGTSAISTIRGDIIVGNYPLDSFCGYPIMKKSEKLNKFYQEGMAGFDKYYESCQNNGAIPGVFLHSFYANDKDSINLVKSIVKKYFCFLALHVGEDETSEYAVKREWNGKGSVQLLKEYDLLTPQTILVHCGVLNESELEQIKKHNSKIAVCPISNDMLLTKTPDPLLLEEIGIDWSIASDGLATGKTANLIEQARFLKERHPRLSDKQLLKAMTQGASNVIGLKTSKSLDIGQDASFLVCNAGSIGDIFHKENPVRSMYIKGNNIDLER